MRTAAPVRTRHAIPLASGGTTGGALVQENIGRSRNRIVTGPLSDREQLEVTQKVDTSMGERVIRRRFSDRGATDVDALCEGGFR
jgi:hypothetical protein